MHMPIKEPVQAVYLKLSRWMLALILTAMIVPSLSFAVFATWIYSRGELEAETKLATPHSDEALGGQVYEANPGPWGRLLCANVLIDLPDEFVVLPPKDLAPTRWMFKKMDRPKAIAFLKSIGASESLVDKIPLSAWRDEVDAISVAPDDELILSLSPRTRSKVYEKVVEAVGAANEQFQPVWFRTEMLEKIIAESGLSESSAKLFRSLLYQNGDPDIWIFMDKDAALRKIGDPAEQTRFIKAMSRKSAIFARLQLDANADVKEAAAYWGVGADRKDILPLLNSAKNVEGGWNVNVIYLLPTFMRTHLFKYPNPSLDPTSVRQDCFWSAFNSLNVTPDDRFADMGFVHETLVRDYYAISKPSQLGDIVFVADGEGVAMHVAVYVADDLVFTKNGYHHTQPWILMRLSDMVETYSVSHPTNSKLNVLFYRKKSM